MKTLHEAGAVADLVRRAHALTPGSVRRWGTMTVDQMIWHVNQGLDHALGRLAVTPRRPALPRPVLKLIALYGYWPKGRVKTMRELKAVAAYDLDAERARLARLLSEMEGRGLGGSWPAHDIFGAFDGWDWSRLQWRHVDYHLKQFGA